MHVITPYDLKRFQIEHYSEMLEKPTSEPQENFLKQQIKLLNENDFDNNSNPANRRFFHRTDSQVFG